MTQDFRALVVLKDEAGYRCEERRLTNTALMDGDVTVAVSHSTVNYKDGLAITGKSPVVRKFPLVPGIDFTGTVESSTDARYKPGDAVVLTGWGVGETHSGGYAEKARVKGDWLVPLAAGLTPARAMAIGTAGFTAMQSIVA
ncbi:MAG TPA: alcohol dehydrogenase catalytic domain-containing protein, partial [Beijerinckiaceae bacterium]|nr:alcohol dehydrogenase catalytic domain-containing protein [Beijerinckiaceae bacterium]